MPIPSYACAGHREARHLRDRLPDRGDAIEVADLYCGSPLPSGSRQQSTTGPSDSAPSPRPAPGRDRATASWTSSSSSRCRRYSSPNRPTTRAGARLRRAGASASHGHLLAENVAALIVGNSPAATRNPEPGNGMSGPHCQRHDRHAGVRDLGQRACRTGATRRRAGEPPALRDRRSARRPPRSSRRRGSGRRSARSGLASGPDPDPPGDPEFAHHRAGPQVGAACAGRRGRGRRQAAHPAR